MLEGLENITTRIGDIQNRMKEISSSYSRQPAQNTTKFSEIMNNRTSDINSVIEEKSKKMGIDKNLIHSVIAVESNYDPNAVSKKGAKGLMQLMPKTASELGVNNAFDVSENVEAGTKYLKQMLGKYNNNLELALAAYNAGPNEVDKTGTVPNIIETKDYVKKVMDKYNDLMDTE